MGVKDANGRGFEYLGSLIYIRDGNDLDLESASFGGGRINKTSGGYETSYFITDHLGSVRATVNQNGALTSTNNYYPFGLRWDEPNALISTNRWLYNGKELQITGFPEIANILDYGLRMNDPRIGGRWYSVDIAAEDFTHMSPYVYAANNPIRLIDRFGMAPEDPEEEEPAMTVQLEEVVVTAKRQNSFNLGNTIPLYAIRYIGSQVGSVAIAATPIITASQFLGALGTLTFTGDAVKNKAIENFSYVVYRVRHKSGAYYIGRASGKGTPEQVLKRRFSRHHVATPANGFEEPEIVDARTINTSNEMHTHGPANRGLEQQTIDQYGGIGSPNVINIKRGGSKINPLGRSYWNASNTIYGPRAPYTGY